MDLLSFSEKGHLKQLQNQKEQLGAKQAELNESKQAIAEVEQKEFNLVFGALERNQNLSREMEERANRAIKDGGIIKVSLSVQGPNDEEPHSIHLDLSNPTVGQNPGLLTYRDRLLNDGISYFRQNITQVMQQLRQSNPQQLSVYNQKKREAQK